MTKDQRKDWEKRTRKAEMQMLAYYQVPHAVYSMADGSFIRRAWMQGYRAGKRAVRYEVGHGRSS